MHFKAFTNFFEEWNTYFLIYGQKRTKIFVQSLPLIWRCNYTSYFYCLLCILSPEISCSIENLQHIQYISNSSIRHWTGCSLNTVLDIGYGANSYCSSTVLVWFIGANSYCSISVLVWFSSANTDLCFTANYLWMEKSYLFLQLYNV